MMRQYNIDIFRDTLNYIKESKTLSNGVNQSIKNTIFYDEDNYPLKDIVNNKEGIISVTKHRSFEASTILKKQYPNKRIGVLNFASATNPGGGVQYGSSAQEESLCRCSNLYPVLITDDLFNKYYGPNRKINNPLHNDGVIYTPDILICKDDTNYPNKLDESDFINVDVLSCAAPDLSDLRGESISDEQLYHLHVKRAEHILNIALFHNIDILVLGAFGCGVFKNDPYIVSKAFKKALEKYHKAFDVVEFAIYTSFDESNYIAFKSNLK